MDQIINQLSETLQSFDIEVEHIEGKYLYIKNGYCIEIENSNLFKLSQDHQVIAPFDDIREMSEFLKNCLALDE